MKDIAGAIAAEEQYIQDRIYNQMDVNIHNYLEPYGYTVLEEYFRDKHYYQLAHCGVEIKPCEVATCMSEMHTAVAQNIPGIWVPTVASGSIFAWHFETYPIDRELFTRYNIPIYEIDSVGGTIISGPEDISMCVAIPSSIDVGTVHIVNRLMQFLQTRIGPSDLDFTNNDILYKGRKVVGVSQKTLANGMFLFWGHISLVDRSPIVEEMGISRSEKLPGSIGHIFTKDELMTDICSWFELTWEG